jgi:hypothetical protein
VPAGDPGAEDHGSGDGGCGEVRDYSVRLATGHATRDSEKPRAIAVYPCAKLSVAV